MDIQALGKRLRELRGDRSLKDVARSIWEGQSYELTDSAINMIEHGKVNNPGARTLDVLAREYGATVEYLLYGTKDKPRAAAGK